MVLSSLGFLSNFFSSMLRVFDPRCGFSKFLPSRSARIIGGARLFSKFSEGARSLGRAPGRKRCFESEILSFGWRESEVEGEP